MKSLSAIVRARSLVELQIIAELWGIPTPQRDDTGIALQIERQMRDQIAARTAWENLSSDERIVMLAIVGPSARNWCLVELLAERSGLPSERTESALAHLCGIFIVDCEMTKMQGSEVVGQRSSFYNYFTTRTHQEPISEKMIAYVPTEIATTMYSIGREFNGVPQDRTTLSLDDLLLPYRQGDLDQIGRRFNLTMQSYSSRNEVRAVIAQNVSQANAVSYAIQQLDPSLQDLYEVLMRNEGRLTLAEVRQKTHWNVPTLLRNLRTFEEYAIAFDGFSNGQRVLFIPSVTLENLRVASLRPHSQTGLCERKVPQSVRPADSTILWDIAAFVWLVAHHEVELTRAQVLPRRTMQRVVPLLNNDLALHSDELTQRYVTQLQLEVIDLAIVQTKNIDDHIRLELGEKLTNWASHDCRLQTLRVLRRWTYNRNWTDRPGAKYRSWMANFISISAARDAMLNVLRQCDPGVWYDVPSLLRTIQGDDPFVIRPNQRFMGQSGFKMTDEVRLHWNETDGELLSGMLSSTLHELGIVSLGYDAPVLAADRSAFNPDAIMLTELGAEVLKDDLGRANTPGERALIVQPNFEILLLEPNMPDLYSLIRFAHVEQLGRASRFTLTRESLLRAISDGIPLEEILQFLRDHSQKEVAQNVVYTLRDWGRQYKEAKLSHVVLIEVDDEILANELCASTKLRDLGLRRVGPNAIAAPEGKALRTVRRAIERAGYATHALDIAAQVVSRLHP